MQNEQKLETGHFGPLRYNEGHPRRGVALRRNEGCLAVARPKGQKVRPPPPWTSLRRNVAVLRCGVGTVHTSHFWIFVSEHFVFVHRLFRNPIK